MSKFLSLAVIFAVAASIGATPPCKDSPKCKDPNEEYVLTKFEEATCDAPTPKTCAPVKECRCKNGLVRNNGECIPLCECPVKCNDPNEEYVTAKFGEPTCDNQNPYPCAPVKECRCRSGYVRYKGVCIKATSCPVRCRDFNEEYVLAKYSEPTCDNPTPKSINPVEECRCRSGFVRNNGRCILPIACPSKCQDPMEEYVKVTTSEKTCEKPNPITIPETTECRCINGYVRNNGRCILPITCPCASSNEMYLTAIFSERTCADPIPRPIEPTMGCQCIGAYVRENGICILPQDCPVTCRDPNEEFITAIVSEMTCSDRTQRSIFPVKECRCKNGYLRDGGRCVLPSTCSVTCPDPMEEYVLVSTSEPTCISPITVSIPPTKECRCRAGFIKNNGKCIMPMFCPCNNPNEEFVTTILSEGTCKDPVPRITSEVTGCRCRPGYVREGGVCIPPCDCPPSCNVNEEFVLSMFSEPTCGDTVLKVVTPVKECRCKHGYLRNDGKCIPQSDCPVMCKDCNEEYVISQYSEPTCYNTIPSLIVTVQECRCKNGFVRDNGKCITPNLCPIICTDLNAEYVTCLFSEPTCSDRVPKSIAPVQECRCKPGFLKNNEGKCVLLADCPVVCADPNAEYVLAQLSEPTCDAPTPVAITPVKECRCKTGFVNQNGRCIRPSDCPVKCSDPMLEEYILTSYTEPTCTNQVPVQMTSSVQECRCKLGYVRDNGKCILPSSCPVICSDPYETLVITSLSDATCADQVPKLLPAPVQECRCKMEYVRDGGKCVLASECPVICPYPNEEYVLTITGEKTCDNQSPASCTPVSECRCKDGYVRDDGKCILVSDCPAKCGNENEEYVSTIYTERTCENPISSYCNPFTGCRCKDGFYRNDGKCIKPCDCPCGPNQVYSLNSPVEPESCSNLGQPRSPLVKPGCVCIDDLVRDCDNKCIPKCECP